MKSECVRDWTFTHKCNYETSRKAHAATKDVIEFGGLRAWDKGNLDHS